MGRKQIIRMAREADIIDFRDADDDPHTAQMVEFLERFAALVAAKAIEDFCTKSGKYLTNDATRDACIAEAVEAEREACAKASEQQIERWVDDRARYAASECASAIRARGQA